MTTPTPARTVEIGFSRLLVADEDVENLVQAAVRRQIDRRVQERREVGYLRRRELEPRHAAIGPARREKFSELPAVLVGLHQLRARQVGAGRPAAAGRPVAEAALAREQLLATLHGGWIEPRFRLLRGHKGHKGY